MLDELDKELEKRGHQFCRYADVSEDAANRVMESIQRFIEHHLKLLLVSTSKSTAVRGGMERKFIGYLLLNNGRLTVVPESLQRFKDKICVLTNRNRGKNWMPGSGGNFAAID